MGEISPTNPLSKKNGMRSQNMTLLTRTLLTLQLEQIRSTTQNMFATMFTTVGNVEVNKTHCHMNHLANFHW